MKVYIESYGCSANTADTNIMKEIISKEYVIVEKPSLADIIIINTCTVRGETERKMIHRIKELEEERKRINGKLIVAGCMAKAQPALISTIAPEASLISPQRIGEINEIIRSRNREIRIVGDGVKELTPIINEVTLTIPIAEGCLGECSYCIVRLARGKLKSRREEEIIKVIEKSIEKGVREIRLTAQDTAAYGLDIGTDLTKLLRRILEIHGKYLLRIGMMTPNNAINIIDDLMEIYEDDRIYKFIHIPLQSGDNDILKLMNRRYSVEEYKEIVDKFRRKFPKGFITTDIISGFPMESEEAHKNTMKILWETMPDKVNAAKYTPRPHTKAAALPQTPDKIKSMRCKEVMEISRRIALERNRMHLGEEAEVLILKRGEEDVFKARMKNYRMVLINACDKMMGERAIAKIVDAKPTHLIGVLTSSWSW